MNNELTINIHSKDKAPYQVTMDVKKVGCSRNASRDVEGTEQTLNEIRTKGYQVHGPASVCFKSRYLLTTEDTIEVQGSQTSGEVEFVAIRHDGNIYISVGSDHNDRSLGDVWTDMLGKIFDTAKTKQMVPAIIAKEAWPYSEVKGHWDEIVLKSWVTSSNEKVQCQEFKLKDLLNLEYYLNHATWFEEDGSILLGGSEGLLPTAPLVYLEQHHATFPTDFHFESFDPILNRSISHGYKVISLEKDGSRSL